MHEEYPENPHFSGRMCRVYVGVTDEQAVYLGAMHQQTSMFQHDVTYIPIFRLFTTDSTEIFSLTCWRKTLRIKQKEANQPERTDTIITVPGLTC